MKLLFDENLSARLVELLAEEFPGSAHVEQGFGRGRTDAELWQFAITQDYVIVSKDNDFRQRAFMSDPPPKVIWLESGNAGTEKIAALLRLHRRQVTRFGSGGDETLLVLRG